MRQLRLIIPVWLLYLALTANLEWSNLIVGFLLAVGIASLLQVQPYSTNWRRLPIALWATIRYIINLIGDLIVSGIQVARIVLDPKLPIQPGIIAIPSDCESDLATALSAHAITLTPGEMVVEIDEKGVMYTHCLDASQASAHVADAQQMRRNLLQKIFA